MAKARQVEFQKHTTNQFGDHEGQGMGQLVILSTEADMVATRSLGLPSTPLMIRSPKSSSLAYETKQVVPYLIDSDGDIIPFGSQSAADVVAARINQEAAPKKKARST